MKSAIISLLFLLMAATAYSQDDIIISKEEMDTSFVPPQYVSDMGKDIMAQLPIARAVKTAGSGFFRDYGINYYVLSMGYEFKMGKPFSINAGIENHIKFQLPYKRELTKREQAFDNSNATFFVEPRWYFDHNKNPVNNLNGNYIAIKGAWIFQMAENQSPSWLAQVKVGSQRQTVQNLFGRTIPAFYDWSVGLGVEMTNDKSPKMSVQYQMLFGNLTSKFWGRNTKEEVLPSPRDMMNWSASNWYYKTRNENMYRFFTDKKHIFKIDFNNVISTINDKTYLADLGLIYERKMSRSMSLNMVVSGQIGKVNNSVDGYLKKNFLKVALEPRFYYKFRKSVELSDNSSFLSGPYLAMQSGYIGQQEQVRLTPVVSETDLSADYLFAHALWGYQTFLSKHIFIDAQLGAGIKTPQKQGLTFFKKGEFSYILGDLKIGFAF